MRKLIMTVALMATMTVANAQNEADNMPHNVSVMNLDYMIKEAPKSDLGTVIGAVLDVLAEQTTSEEPGYAEQKLLIISTD